MQRQRRVLIRNLDSSQGTRSEGQWQHNKISATVRSNCEQREKPRSSSHVPQEPNLGTEKEESDCAERAPDE